MDDTDRELERAMRRIAQLESALARRTELLERSTAELANIRAGKAFRAANAFGKIVNRFFPIHTRRRAWLRNSAKSLGGVFGWLLRGRAAKNGPPPEARHLTEATPVDEYRRWQKRFEPNAKQIAALNELKFQHEAVISIAVPVFNPPVKYLQALVESVLDQTYGRWDLCLADASTQPECIAAVAAMAKRDTRIKFVRLERNLGIAGNTNAAMALASGEFIAFADHDDALAPFALTEIAKAIERHPEADFFYSDEDKLDSAGERVEPNFKPDWSPETLLSRNYICHLTVLKRTLLEELGGLRDGFDGAQDYDLVLRASERAKRIVHIPNVLYHWRMHAASTASNKGSKHYAFENGRRAIAEHLARTGIDATVDHGPILGTYRVISHLRTQPKVTIVIPNRDHADVLKRCLDSLATSCYANYDVLIVENGSTAPETHAYYAEITKQPHVDILHWTAPFNYAAVNNFAAARAGGELLLFLNNDIEAINPDWLEELVKMAVRPGVGIVGAKLYYADDTIQHAGIVVGMGGVAGHGHLDFPREAAGHMQRLQFAQNVAAVTGACLLIPKRVFDEVGGFDEGFVLAFNDVDLCLKVLAKGYRVVWTPSAELYHLESKTRGPEDTPEKEARFKREYDLFHAKWGEFLRKGDPYYSPHFRLDRPDFALNTA